MADLICDFCGRPDPQWDYHCKPFVVHVNFEPIYEDSGVWAACDVCKLLVEAVKTSGDVDQLVANSMESPFFAGGGDLDPANRMFVAIQTRAKLRAFLDTASEATPLAP